MKMLLWQLVGSPAPWVRSRLTLRLLGICALAMRLQAAPFDQPIDFTQPDGARIELRGWGDEFHALFETRGTGFTVVFDPALRAYCFARLAADGSLASTGVQVQHGDPVALGLTPGLRMSAEARKKAVVERWQRWEQGMQTRQRWAEQKAAMRRFYDRAGADGPQFAPPPFTTTGLKVGLTLLVDFSDDPSTVPQAEIVNYLNGDNYTGYGNNGSVKSYFHDNSNGTLTYTNVVTIYLRAPQPKTFYNDVTKDAGDQANILIKDVIEVMKALPNYTTVILPTFDALTVDNNNEVVACNVFYTGGNGGVWAMGLWPHSWALVNVGAQELSPGGKKVWRYQITDIGSRLEIGTFCHENGHMLCGYPDLYDYDYDSVGGAGMFCLMGYGGDGGNPVQISAYLKRASGWATVTELDATSSLNATVTASGGPNFNHFYRFEKPGTPTEYFLVENRQQQGRDARLPASGVAIWHVDELGDRDDQRIAYNTTHSNYECSLVQADNQFHFQRYINAGDARDLYYAGNPASGYANEFSDVTAPSARWWDGTESGVMFADFSANSDAMTFRVGSGLFSLSIESVTVSGGNENGIIDLNECNQLNIVLQNNSDTPATGVSVQLTTSTPGVAFGTKSSAYANIPAAELGTNLVPFTLSTAPGFVCGTPILLNVAIKSDQWTSTDSIILESGTNGVPRRFDNSVPVAIPDGNPAGVGSVIAVSNLTSAIKKIGVSLHLTHSRIGDVTVELISPEGITNVLAKERGATGDNYGVACSPESFRTTFDDAASTPIESGFPPFLGDYRPESALSVYIGRSGTNLNGNWTLRVVDGAAGVTGTLQCWSLLITPAECVDGGGSCPGADLAIGMVDVPDPVFVGSNLVYHISVTNNGPGTARNVVVNHQLPSSVIFVSAVASQGSVVSGSGSVNGNLGILPLSGVATMTVIVTPTTVGTISSMASVTSSLDPDGDTSDNNVTVTTRVNPPTTDLAISLTDAPDPGLVGSPLTYTVHVINNGPSTASGVTVTNLLPVSVVVQSASPSQGVANISGSVVVFQLGSLLPGGQATGTIKVIPTADGTLVATATVIGNQVDPVMANNTALTSTTVGPAADLAVSLTDMPDPVVLNSNLTYRITVTNLGPSLATGVVLNHALPAGVVLQSSNTTQGAITVSGNNVIGNLGSLVKNAGAVVTLVVRPTVAGTITANSSVTGSQTDPNSANNTALATTVVAGPFVSIQPAGATLTSESLTPPNGALDVGETVTVELRLRNSGNVHNTNLFATLLPLGGVAAPNPATPQAYGVLPPDGSPRSRTFAFTATGTNGGVVLATLQLQDGPNVLSNVVFAFSLPRTSSFQNSAQIVIPDAGAAAPYPSTLTVSGITGTVGRVSVTLSNLTHTYPSDVDVLLVGPLGQKVILMSAAGDRYGVTNVNLTFDDLAAEVVPGASPIFTGNYRPTAYNPSPAFPAPAPASPYGTALSAFAGSNPNGVWSLFVADHSVGDAGTILSGWSLAIDAISPVNRQADLSIVGVASPNPAVVDENLTWTFTITNLGPDTAGAVAFTNSLPAGLAVVSAVSSQGSCVVDGTQVVGNLGSLNAHSNATVVVVTTPTGPGFFTNVAKVASGEVDLNPANNTVAVTANGLLPVTDLALGQSAAPAPDVVVRSNVTFVVSVTNAGPGAALSTVLTNTLTAGANVVSVELSAGTYSIVGPQVVCSFGKLMPGDIATATIVAQPLVLGSFANTGVATTVSHDTDGSNNGATADVTVIAARPVIEAAGAWVVAESRLPANGAIDPGETVTMTLGLKNTGQIGTSNLVATLLAGGGVVDPDGPKVYGSTAPDGGVGFGNFSFKAEATPHGVITATLNVSEGSLPLGTVTFIFDLVRTVSYTNPTAIVIPNLGIAAPYPSVISVADVTGQVTRATVTLHGLSHSFPDDLDMMLVGPEGQRLVLMSDAGGSHAVTNLMLAFDGMANEFLPDTTRLATGVFKPADYETGDVFPAPAPPGPRSAQLAVFGGTDPNGDWSLYVVDDTLGDAGTIGGGWSLTLETAVPVTPLANLGLAASGAPANIFTGSDVTYALRVTNRGPTSASGIVVTQTLPAGAAFITASASQGGFVVNGGEVVFNAGALPVGAWSEFTVVAKLTVAGEASSAITLTANEADLDLSDNAATVMTSVVTPIPAELSGSYDSDTGLFWVTLNGQAGSTYVLQASENLVSWSPIATNTAPANGIIQFSDADAPSYSQRYYRAVQFAP